MARVRGGALGGQARVLVTLVPVTSARIVDRLRCGPLAAWAGAWLAGTAGFDDVLTTAAIGSAAPELGLSAPRVGSVRPTPLPEDGRLVALGEILIAWRQAGARTRLVLPVPGDVRGLPGPAGFRTAAIDAGQAVVGAVPLVIDHYPSSAPATLTWQRFDIEEPASDIVAVTDAQYELTEAIRECASALARIDISALTAPAELNDELAAARRAGERINLPPGFPPRAVSLIAQAERMAAVLTLAGAVTSADRDGRTVALAPLVSAVRRARLAGYNATV
jgi:hypothetical protein